MRDENIRIQEILDTLSYPFKYGVAMGKVQRLSYLAHGYTLALFDAPLLPSRYVMWKNGPMNLELLYASNTVPHYGEVLGYDQPENPVVSDMLLFLEQISNQDGSNLPSQGLTSREKDVLELVISHYGALSGMEISEVLKKVGLVPAHLYAEYMNNSKPRQYIENSLIKATFLDYLAKN